MKKLATASGFFRYRITALNDDLSGLRFNRSFFYTFWCPSTHDPRSTFAEMVAATKKPGDEPGLCFVRCAMTCHLTSPAPIEAWRTSESQGDEPAFSVCDDLQAH